MKYLTNKDLTSTDELPTSSKRACINFGTDLFLKLFKPESVQPTTSNGSGMRSANLTPAGLPTPTQATSTSTALSHKDYLSEQLRFAINKEQAAISSTTTGSDTSWEIATKKELKLEFATYEQSNKLGQNLQALLLSALKTIQPTSVQCERNFSLSTNFCTKIKSRLNDKSLNNLCFLKSYFLQNKNK